MKHVDRTAVIACCLAGRLQWGDGERMQLAAELVEGLSGMGRLHDAALVSLQHLRNTDAAVQLFCSAHEWRQANLSAITPMYCLSTHSEEAWMSHLTIKAGNQQQ